MVSAALNPTRSDLGIASLTLTSSGGTSRLAHAANVQGAHRLFSTPSHDTKSTVSGLTSRQWTQIWSAIRISRIVCRLPLMFRALCYIGKTFTDSFSLVDGAFDRHRLQGLDGGDALDQERLLLGGAEL
ncbi:hypothetical protein [Bradyrhizobium sp. SZCCHNRI1003]|uniref:hypothetical protein n=1 Tax=Bradyrhizobium sp. SZCCHNRI1003 TaxID=3057275 RepID=UPI0029165C93|nr:hypothetical protein [Bradyrhizobium sp. SZCCHNRI1003]